MLWNQVLWLWRLVQAACLLVAVRVCIRKPSRAAVLLTLSCILFIAPTVSWFMLPLSLGFVLSHPYRIHQLCAAEQWFNHISILSQLLGLVAFLAALVFFTRDRDTKPTI